MKDLDKEIIKEIRENPYFASKLKANATFGQRVADHIASFGGSWPFLIMFFTFLTAWIIWNTAQFFHPHYDPYPYILLNLLLSCLAAVQAPIIMMSSNRMNNIDRLRDEEAFKQLLDLNVKLDYIIEKEIERQKTSQ